jgi:hypothetical protein
VRATRSTLLAIAVPAAAYLALLVLVPVLWHVQTAEHALL